MSALAFTTCSIFLFYELPPTAYCKEKDSQGYIKLAKRLSSSGLSKIKKITDVGIGYPAALTCIVMKEDFHFLLVLFQLLLALATLGLVFKATQQIYNESTASVVAILFSMHLGFLTYVQCCLTEIMLVFLYTFVLERLVSCLEKCTPSKMGSAGFLLGLSLWIKPAAWFYGWFLIIIGIVYVLFKRDHFKALLTFASCFLAMAFSYFDFNLYYFNSFSFPPLMYTNLYFYLLPKALAQVQSMSFNEACDWVHYLAIDERITILKKVIFSYSKTVATIWSENMFKTIFGLFGYHLKALIDVSLKTGVSFFDYSGSYLDKLYAYCWSGEIPIWIKCLVSAETIYTLLRIPLLLNGLYGLYKKQSLILCFLFLTTIFYFIFITGADGGARLRMMIEPLLLILTAIGIVEFSMLGKKLIPSKKETYE